MTNHPKSQSDSPNSSPAPAVSVTLAIPSDLAKAIRERATQLGRSPADVIINLLRSGLELHSTAESSLTAISTSQWQDLAVRLETLETLIPRVAHLESTLNSLPSDPWAGDSSERATISPTEGVPQPPATESFPAPAHLAAETEWDQLELCPRCDRKLGAPLKSSGRKVCSYCGWSDRPRQTLSTPPSAELSDADLQSLLTKATEESLQNIKRNKNTPKPGDRRPQFPKLPPFS